MRIRYVNLIAISLAALFSLSSCLVETNLIGSGGSSGGTKAVVDPNDSPSEMKRAICDPFSTNSTLARDRGLFGNVYYLPDDRPRYKNVEDYIQNGVMIDANIYLDRLFVQTHPWDTGFKDQAGRIVEVDNRKLYENFAVDVSAQLKLGENEEPGYYQLALISDDGALLKRIDENGNEVILVNNNGSHPTKMACASEPIYLDRDTKIPIKMQQFQGPRKNITMVAMWRPVASANSNSPEDREATNYCDKGGNGLFFDSTKTPIKFKKPFYDLLLSQWKVLENENYEFPEQAENPCAPSEEPLLLTGFSITTVSRNFVTVRWNTNIPAGSQVEVKNISNGATLRGALDPVPMLQHEMTQQGLSPNTLYSIRAVSTSPGGQTVISDERVFRTPR